MRQVFNVVVAMGLLCAGVVAAERAYMEVPLKKLVVSESGFYVVREGADAVSFRSLRAEKGRLYSVHPLSVSSVPEEGQKGVFLLSDAVRFYLVAEAHGKASIEVSGSSDGSASAGGAVVVEGDNGNWRVKGEGTVQRDPNGNVDAQGTATLEFDF